MANETQWPAMVASISHMGNVRRRQIRGVRDGFFFKLLRKTRFQPVSTFVVAAVMALFVVAAGYAGDPIIVTIPPGASASQIQLALDRLPDTGGEVVLSPGTYEIRQPIVLRRDHQMLRGTGTATLLKLADKANCPVIVLGEAVNKPRRVVAHLRLSDLTIDGNRQHQQVELWKTGGDGSEIRNNGVTVHGASDVLVERVVCCRCRSGGLVTSRDVRRLAVRDFTAVDNEFDGLACYQTTECSFTQLFLHDNRAAGISVDLGFAHNIVSDAILADNSVGIFMRDSHANLFQGIVIRRSRKYGVFMAQSVRDASGGAQLYSGSECTGNSFVGLMVSGSGGAAFCVNNASCTNNLICGAQFICNAKGGLVQDAPNLVTVYGVLGSE